MSDKEIEIEIDGRTLKALPTQTVIQVADEAGIYIPRFCYHKHLSIAANCRMCLVEVEKSPKTLPACATPVMPGMKVFTTSSKTRAAQRAVMEFLLINHPLDCPICDQGGECELQDLAMGYGSSHSHYQEEKRAVEDLPLGPLIATEMTRCIHCTRCVRFGDEIAGLRELGMTFRGENSEITTYVQHAIQSEVSGNMIDLCPVGALTAKPSRFVARPWELDQANSISPHDCIGSHIAIHTLYGKVIRVVPSEKSNINQTWISDRDRFSYSGLYHPIRLKEPMIKVNGVWQVVDWEQALTVAATHIQETITAHGADKFAGIATPQATLEECYLLQKLVRGLGSPHVDHRLREIDTRDQHEVSPFPGFQTSLDELEQCDAIVIIGSNLSKEQPLVALRLRKAALKGVKVSVINSVKAGFHFPLQAQSIVAPHRLHACLSELLTAVHHQDGNHLLAQSLQGKNKICLVIGALVLHHPEAAALRSVIKQLAEVLGATINYLTDGPNTAGAWLAGAIPHRQPGGKALNHAGLSAYDMFAKPRKGYLLVNVEPDLDCANATFATAAIQQAECLIALSLYRNTFIEEHAQVILPMTPFTETSGTFVNAMGDWQTFAGVAKAYHAARPAWKILRALGNFLNLDGFNYEDTDSIRNELKILTQTASVTSKTSAASTTGSYPVKQNGMNCSRIGEIPLYAIDSLVRHAEPLQTAQHLMLGDIAVARLHPLTAKQLHLTDAKAVSVQQHHQTLVLPLVLDESIAEEAVWIAGGIKATRSLGDLLGTIEIKKADSC